MPKTVQFDENRVLTAAMETFWQHGYGATSLKDLERATGLTTGSIYNSFRDKDQLFLMSLSHYIDTVVSRRIAKYLEADDARWGLEAYVENSLKFAPSLGRKGCLISNSVAERGRLTPAARKMLQGAADRIDAAILKTVTRAQKAGQISRRMDAPSLSARLSLILSGAMSQFGRTQGPEWPKMVMRFVGELLDG